MIRIQPEPFDVGAEYSAFKKGRTETGGYAMFVGSVRGEGEIATLTLEHYPGMTEDALAAIELDTRARWRLDDVLVVHRYGPMKPGEDIVLVITASAHRQDAFDACQFLMDWLKTKAPFWKLEETPDGTRWVDAKSSDDAAAARWSLAD
jgi:molybdopterin synthase catalytic subunit